MTNATKTILFAGGGTGGHLFPGIAVAEELLEKNKDFNILFGGSNRKIEKQIVQNAGFQHLEFASEPSTSLKRNPLRYLWNLWKAGRQARKQLKQTQPAAIIGLGGYASVPIILAARSSKIPVILLEQNAVAGRATKLLSRWADLICLSYPETEGKLSTSPRQVVTGNPVRKELTTHQTDKTQKQILILGGSQGSLNLNRMVLKALPEIESELQGWKIVHQTGERDFDHVKQAYAKLNVKQEVAPFFQEMACLYRESAFAICRAGATTLAELACSGCPAILVPYPNSIGDHQDRNAEYFEHSGAAVIQWENRENKQSLTEQITQFLLDEKLRSNSSHAISSLAQPKAAKKVAELVLELLE